MRRRRLNNLGVLRRHVADRIGPIREKVQMRTRTMLGDELNKEVVYQRQL